MQLMYFLSGDATVHDGSGTGVFGDPWVQANLIVFKGQTATNLGTEEGRLKVSLVNGGAVAPGVGPGRWIVNVNFDYGTPFNLTTVLSVAVRSDATFNFLPNGTLVKTGGIIEMVEGDFANSADLHRVFVPVGANLSADSLFNYAPLVRFGIAPIPLPGAVYLMGSALLLLGAKYRKSRPRFR